MRLVAVLCVLVVATPGSIEGATKTWTSNTNFANPDNWSQRRVPCYKDTVVFPADARVAVFMPPTASFKELILPMNGELIFPTDGTFQLNENTGGGWCPGDVIKFIATEAKDWFDLNNWNVSDAAMGHVPNDIPPIAVPHSERVPCPEDLVVFPAGTTFRVQLTAVAGVRPTVGSMKINGRRLNGAGLSAFRATSTGRELFAGDVEVAFVNDGCNDPSGCACGNDQTEVLKRICRYMTPYCPPLQCTDPIQPIGHCCRICASQLMLEINSGFKYKIVHHLFQTSINKEAYKEVQGYMSKTYDGRIQMVMVDSGLVKGGASLLADMLHSFLKQDLEGMDLYRLKSAIRQKSVRWFKGVPTYGFLTSPAKGPGAGTVVGIVFGIFLFIGSAAAAVYICRRRRFPGFAFARFITDTGKIELELGTTPHEMLDPCETEPHPSKAITGFENPIYGSPGAAASMYGGDEKETTLEGENPLYGQVDKDSQM